MQLDGRFLKAPSNLSANSQSAFLIRLKRRITLFSFCSFDSFFALLCESKSDVLKALIQEIVCLFVLRVQSKLCFQLLGYYANQFLSSASFRVSTTFSIYSKSKSISTQAHTKMGMQFLLIRKLVMPIL